MLGATVTTRLSSIVFTFFSFVYVTAFAESSGVYRLGEIQILSGSQQSEPISAIIIDEEKIKNFGGSSISDSLKYIEGITPNLVGNRNEQAVYIRGYDLRQIPILIDGIPIYIPFDGYMDLARISINDLSQIQVLKGYVSVLNGPNTLGGAINLVSKKPSKEYSADIRTSMLMDKNLNTNGNDLGLNLGISKEKWYSVINLTGHDKSQWRLSDDYQLNSKQNSAIRDNSYTHDKKMNLKVAYTPNSDDEYSMNYIIQDDNKGNPPYAGNDSTLKARFWRWPYWKKESLYWISNTQFDEYSYLKFRLYLDKFKNSLYSYDDNTYLKISKSYAFKSFYDDYSCGSSLEYGHKLSAIDELKMALHFKQDHHSEYNEGELTRNFVDNTSSIAFENLLTPYILRTPISQKVWYNKIS